MSASPFEETHSLANCPLQRKPAARIELGHQLLQRAFGQFFPTLHFKAIATIMFLSDHESPIDLLYYDAIAKTVVKLIQSSKGRPISVGLHGDWGAGKSSILAMVEGQLKGHETFLCLRFNGWQLQGFEDAKAALIETIITELREAKKEQQTVFDKAGEVLRRVDKIKLLKKGAPWIFSALTGIPHPGAIKDAVGLLKTLTNTAQEALTPEKIKATVEAAEGILKPAEEEKIPEQIREFEREFGELLEVAKVEKLVVLIDDLDRCLPNTAIDTLEAIRLFLFTPKTAFIVAADEAMIEYAVKKHFPDLPETSGPASYARNYLEKLIQVPFRIPALGLTETQIYIALVLIQEVLGEENSAFGKILEKARDCLGKPWLAKAFDHNTIEGLLGKTTPKEKELNAHVNDALTLSLQICRPLTEGTRGNPRQIKRFLNSILLRGEIAEARGLGSEIKKAHLAKIMLAEAFRSTFYNQLTRWADSAADGKPTELKRIETSVRAKEGDTTEAGEKADGDVSDLIKDEWIQAWARSEPSLQDVDLRPYLFISRDRRGYLAGATGKLHLEALVAGLLGESMAVAKVTPAVQKLKPAEGEEVFGAVESQLMQGGRFDDRPHGLIVLAKTFASLQERLLHFLDHIPAANRKVWMMTGFDTVFLQPQVMAEYEKLKQAWAESSPALAAAAKFSPKTKGK